jgi:hypothetical protein
MRPTRGVAPTVLLSRRMSPLTLLHKLRFRLFVAIDAELRRIVEHRRTPTALEERGPVIALAPRNDYIPKIDALTDWTHEGHGSR